MSLGAAATRTGLRGGLRPPAGPALPARDVIFSAGVPTGSPARAPTPSSIRRYRPSCPGCSTPSRSADCGGRLGLIVSVHPARPSMTSSTNRRFASSTSRSSCPRLAPVMWNRSIPSPASSSRRSVQKPAGPMMAKRSANSRGDHIRLGSGAGMLIHVVAPWNLQHDAVVVLAYHSVYLSVHTGEPNERGDSALAQCEGAIRVVVNDDGDVGANGNVRIGCTRHVDRPAHSLGVRSNRQRDPIAKPRCELDGAWAAGHHPHGHRRAPVDHP